MLIRSSMARFPVVLLVAAACIPVAGMTAAPLEADTVGPVEAIAALRRATAVPIIAEIPQLSLRMPRASGEGEADTRLKAVSSSLHYHWVRRSASLVLQRRYLSPAEAPDVEVAELTASVGDLRRLVLPLTSGWEARIETQNHDQFFEGLSPEQKAAMRNPQGMPFQQLSPEQQTLWNRISMDQAFGHELLSVGRVYRILAGWNQAELAYLERPTIFPDGHRELVRGLWFRYPDPSEPEGWAGDSMPPPAEAVGADRPAAATAAGVELPKRAPLPAAFNARLVGKDGETTLGELCDQVSRTVSRKVGVPAYARRRPLIAAVSGARASEVVTAIEDLYGWSFRKVDESYLVDRSTIPTPRNLAELHALLRAAVPPAMKLLWAEDDPHGLSGARANWQRSLVYLAVRKEKGPNWTQARITELDEQTQRRMANYLFGGKIRSSRTADSRLAQYLLTPSEGYFILKGSENRPLITYNAPRPDGDIDIWGWAVKSSSRYRK